MELHDEVRDGLRSFTVHSGRETMRASLFFRVGQADESLATCGWTHLLEHSALHDWNDPRLGFNASVGLYTTRFDLDGEPEAVLEHLTRLTQWLAAPDLTRVEHEAKILQAESEQRPVGAAALNLEWRYGAQGPGLPAYREVGLSRASRDGLRGWARRMFVASNAVLAADHHLPDDFTHDLPVGVAHLPRLPEPVTSSVRGQHVVPSGLVASGTVARSFAASLTTDVITRTLTDSLRAGQGVAYSPWATLERVDRETALLTCGSDISAEGEATCGKDFMAVISQLAHDGPSQSVLDDMAIVRKRQLGDPAIAPGVAWSAAEAVLTGSEIYTFEQARSALDAVTPEQVAGVVDELRRSMMLGLPPGAEEVLGLPVLRQPTSAVVPGAKRYLNGSGDGALWLSDQALQYAANGGELTTVHFADVAGMLEFPDGARRLVSTSGWGIMVEPTVYRGGTRIVEALDTRVPAGLRLPQPARDPRYVPPKVRTLTRIRHWFWSYGTAFRQAKAFQKVGIVLSRVLVAYLVIQVVRVLLQALTT